VADHNDENGQEPLNEHERELIREVVREIVKETVLAKDTERQAVLEASKLKVEAAKTQVLISSGSLVGIAAVVNVLPTQQQQFFILGAVIFLGLSVIGGFVWIEYIARAVTDLRHPPREISWFGPSLLALGLVSFGLYVFYNVSGEWAEAPIVLWPLTAVVVLLGIISFTAGVVLWSRIEDTGGTQEGSQSPWWRFWR
jgi:hypothetical protein